MLCVAFRNSPNPTMKPPFVFVGATAGIEPGNAEAAITPASEAAITEHASLSTRR